VALKFSLTLIVVLVSLVAGWLSLRAGESQGKQDALGIGEAFAAGVFLGAGLIHMLGDADATFDAQGVDFPYAPLLCGAVVLALLWAEHFGDLVARQSGPASAVLPLTAVAMLSVHSLLMGAAFGITSSLSIAMAVFVAVLAHKGAASFALGIELARSPMSHSRQRLLFLFFVVMFPAGVLIGQSVSHMTSAHPLVEASFSALAAGTFLFFGTLHGLASSPFIARCGNTREYGSAVAGFGLMAVVAIWT
jgi:zinc transporter ZupT